MYMFAITLFILVTVPSLLLAERNVALGKVATQSSNYSPSQGLAGVAIDGNSDGAWTSQSVTHTNYDLNAWWQVDLQAAVIINKIVVHNRIDCCMERLANFKIMLLSSSGAVIATVTMTGIQQTYTWSFTPTPVQIVKIQLVGTNHLSLAEVEVLQASKNLALGKTATQSSQYSTGVASLAVDGSSDGQWPKTTHTNSDSGAWWRVDLVTASSVTQVIVHNRADCCQERLNNFFIVLQDINGNTIATSKAFVGVQPVYSWTFQPVSGVRYVKVQLVGTNYLSLAEVEVIGAATSTNIAVGQQTDQSSTYSSIAQSGNAVDGNNGGAYTGASITHTSDDAYAFWNVYFTTARDISKIVLYNRVDCCSERLVPVQVTAYDANGLSITSIVFYSNQFQLTLSRQIQGVKRIKVGFTGSSARPLSLAEVEVYHNIIPDLSACTVWNGTPFKVGDIIALQAQAIRNAFNYVQNKNFLVPDIYGSNPYNQYTFKATSTATTPPPESLFQIKTLSTASGKGYDVTLLNIVTGQSLAVLRGVQGHPAQQYPRTSSTDVSTSFRLANNFRVWTDRNCGNCASTETVSPPTIVPQIPLNSDMYSCSQSIDQYGNVNWWQCGDYYVSFTGYGGETNTQLARFIDYYTVYTCGSINPGSLAETQEESSHHGLIAHAGVIGIAVGCVVGVVVLVVLVIFLVKWRKSQSEKINEGMHGSELYVKLTE